MLPRVVPSLELATLGDPAGELIEPPHNTLETRGAKKAVGAQERDLGRQEYCRAIRERPGEFFTNGHPREEALVIQIPINEEAQNINGLQPAIDQHPNNQEENAQQPEPTMAARAKNCPVFSGKKTEDADIHVNRFEHYWKVARPPGP